MGANIDICILIYRKSNSTFSILLGTYVNTDSHRYTPSYLDFLFTNGKYNSRLPALFTDITDSFNITFAWLKTCPLIDVRVNIEHQAKQNPLLVAFTDKYGSNF